MSCYTHGPGINVTNWKIYSTQHLAIKWTNLQNDQTYQNQHLSKFMMSFTFRGVKKTIDPGVTETKKTHISGSGSYARRSGETLPMGSMTFWSSTLRTKKNFSKRSRVFNIPQKKGLDTVNCPVGFISFPRKTICWKDKWRTNKLSNKNCVSFKLVIVMLIYLPMLASIEQIFNSKKSKLKQGKSTIVTKKMYGSNHLL